MSKRPIASEYQPSGDWILIRRATAEAPKGTPKLLAAEARADGGFDVTTAAATFRKNQGIVEAIGDGEYQNGILIPVRSKVGQLVAFAEQAAVEAEKFFPELAGLQMFFIPDSMVLCRKTDAQAERRAISA